MIMFLNLSDIVAEGMFRPELFVLVFVFVCVCVWGGAGGYLCIGQIRECPPPRLLYS